MFKLMGKEINAFLGAGPMIADQNEMSYCVHPEPSLFATVYIGGF